MRAVSRALHSRLPTPVRTGSGSTGLSQPSRDLRRHPGRVLESYGRSRGGESGTDGTGRSKGLKGLPEIVSPVSSLESLQSPCPYCFSIQNTVLIFSPFGFTPMVVLV